MPDDIDRKQIEDDLISDLSVLLRGLAENQYRSLDEWRDDLVAAMAASLARVFDEAFRGLMERLNLPILGGAGVSMTAISWGARYSRTFVRYLLEHKQGLLDAATNMTAVAFASYIANRASAIAVTEITRAMTRGEREAVKSAHDAFGVRIVGYWWTQDGACPVCAPLDGQPEHVWKWRFTMGPPAHIRCKCRVTWERASFGGGI